jgi:curved DNA-binding protein CbpA
MPTDFYDLLGVSRDASQEEIRRAFRRQVRKYHPDLNDDPRARAQFTALKKAYDTLGDAKERDAYDRMGHDEYVGTRISGLPSPDQWQVPDDADQSATATTRGGTATASTAESRSRRSRERTRSGRSGPDGTATESATTGATTGSASGDTRRERRDRTGSRRGSTAERSATADGGTTASAAGPTAQEGSLTRLRRRLRRVNLGWPMITVADGLYLTGLWLYVLANLDAVRTLLADLAVAGDFAGAMAALSTRGGVETVAAFVTGSFVDGAGVAGGLLLAGAAAMPAVYLLIVRETRRTRTPWQPSYLYALAAMGPVAGLVVDALVAPPGLYVDVVAYFLAPVLAVLALPFSAFVRPRLARVVRRTVRKVRG